MFIFSLVLNSFFRNYPFLAFVECPSKLIAYIKTYLLENRLCHSHLLFLSFLVATEYPVMAGLC